MPCPRCGSNNLWDDNLWWGCAEKTCDFMSSTVRNAYSSADRFNEPIVPALTRDRPDLNRWWWEGYDAREAEKPYAILTTSQDWRQGWVHRDDEIKRGLPWIEPIVED